MFEKKNKVWIFFVIALMALFVGGWLISSSSFSSEIEVAKAESKRDMQLIAVLVKEHLQERNYQDARDFVIKWGKYSPHLVEVSLIASNGFRLAHYRRDINSIHNIHEQQKIQFSYDREVILKLSRSIDYVYINHHYFQLQLIAIFIFIAVVLFLLVILNVRAQHQS